jgi:hypothetical protein
MKNIRTLLGLVVLLVTLSAPAFAGDMPTPPAPEPPPSTPSDPPTATANGDMPTPPMAVVIETLGLVLSLF